MGGRLRLGADAGVEVGGLVHCTDAGQLLRGKAEDGAGHGGGQRDIAAGIVDDLQQLQEDLDLGGLQQIAARARVAGDAALLQRGLVLTSTEQFARLFDICSTAITPRIPVIFRHHSDAVSRI